MKLSRAADGRYVYEKSSSSEGLLAVLRGEAVVERSEGHDRNGQLRPLAYSFKRTNKRKNRDVKIEFDWDKQRVRTTVNGEPWQMPLPEGTLDKLIYLLAMMRDLADGKRSLQYTVADGGKLKTYHVESLGEEPLETALGSLHTVKVKRFRHNKKRETILWCAPALGFLPVRMEHREKDGTAVMLIQSVRGFDLENRTASEP